METLINKKNFWVLVGTRPEVIKQVPLYLELVKRYGKDKVALIGTGQHRELLDQALGHFNIKLDINLSIMTADQTLSSSSAAVLHGISGLFAYGKPKWMIVQGDTTSAAMAAWAAFQSGVKVAHNEAGLRSYNLQHPFPEEANRKLIGVIADLHLAPTEYACQALLREGVDPKKIFVTGNSGIDALKWTLSQPTPNSVNELLSDLNKDGLSPVLVTAHRRENRESMDEWFQALRSFLDSNSHLAVICPLHPNHAAKEAAEKHLGGLKQARIIPAMDYGQTCHLLSRCSFVVTDSGGIQEEASTLGVPVVICRKTTERMEAVHAGVAILAGTEPHSILKGMEWAAKKERVRRNGLVFNIFGDGNSSARIADLFSSESPNENRIRPTTKRYLKTSSTQAYSVLH